MLEAAAAVRPKILHADFARRFQIACDGNQKVPLPNYGRLGWFVTKLAERGTSVTIETVRKWFAGESRPRTKAMTDLAIVLEVDEAWLAVGKSPEITEKQQKVRNASADGVVNVVAGLIQVCGGHPAFPVEGDAKAAAQKIDLTAVIKGAMYAFHITLAQLKDDGLHFAVPVEAVENTLVIGAVRTGELSFNFYELDAETLAAHGKQKGEVVDFAATPEWLDSDSNRIKTFSQRL